jgi:hypothetical protein
MAEIRIPVEKLPPPDKNGDHAFQFRIISVDKNQWSAWSQLYVLKSIGQYRPLEPEDITLVLGTDDVSVTWDTPTIYNYSSASITSASIAHNHSQNFKQHEADVFVQWDGGDIAYHDRVLSDTTTIVVPAESASVRVIAMSAVKNVPQIDTYEEPEEYRTRLYQYLGIGSRKNLIPNPSFETNITGWNGSNVTISQSTTFAKYGVDSLKGVVATTGVNRYIDKSQSDVFITSGKTYTASCWVYLPATNTADVNLVFKVYGWESTGYSVTTILESKTVTRGVWTRFSGTFTPINGATAPATNLLLRIQNDASWAAGQEIYIDGAMLEESSNLDFYFDGTSIDGSVQIQEQLWDGASHASPSTLNYHMPNLTGTYDLFKILDTGTVSLVE